MGEGISPLVRDMFVAETMDLDAKKLARRTNGKLV